MGRDETPQIQRESGQRQDIYAKQIFLCPLSCSRMEIGISPLPLFSLISNLGANVGLCWKLGGSSLLTFAMLSKSWLSCVAPRHPEPQSSHFDFGSKCWSLLIPKICVLNQLSEVPAVSQRLRIVFDAKCWIARSNRPPKEKPEKPRGKDKRISEANFLV